MLTLVRRNKLGSCSRRARARSFSEYSMLRSFSKTYHSLWRSSHDFGRKSRASHPLPAGNAQSAFRMVLWAHASLNQTHSGWTENNAARAASLRP